MQTYIDLGPHIRLGLDAVERKKGKGVFERDGLLTAPSCSSSYALKPLLLLPGGGVARKVDRSLERS
jgi:hypothetical protein